MSEQESYWQNFYASRASKAVPEHPSPFASWVAPKLADDESVVEFGFGNARDSLWLCETGRRLLGFDFAQSAVDLARREAHTRGRLATFERLDLYDADSVTQAHGRIGALGATVSIYARFLIHALDDAGRRNLLDLAATCLTGRGRLYLEFRTVQDEQTEHAFGEDHYRRYVDAETVAAEIKERGGQIDHLETGFGLAVFDSGSKYEDPFVARIVASWPG